MVIELIGGVGAGKSRILQILREEYGAEVVETDQEARNLEQKGQEGCRRLAEAFGERILTPDGELDREKLAEMVFSDWSVLEQVNSMIHPLVWERIHQKAEDFRKAASDRGEERARQENARQESASRERTGQESAGRDSNPPPLLVVETAIPDKKPGDIYDEVWYVYTLKDIRIQRLMESRGYSREKCLSVMEKQCTEGEYRELANRVIDNNGSLEDVRRQIGEMLG